ncbi:hypothetical protein PUNSTDRAFT_50481 [Punctularia strigosozonata HHB-11173 SS5]|uniref:uncharacterized protein n=1 Tax=Punctularia strigosozonata (strain HHB-11173) TaxID=741275 RepID=UPI0004418444|nr:uncharacterized protein PUNSTDRAFT_50481 [Punctularia strigosozonata HHB-11173 SS5]EIN11526.1 hypothetical protein PUNSTDRAFT_50481 [Punctularia strigosozonata HHB-11173 SS5]
MALHVFHSTSWEGEGVTTSYQWAPITSATAKSPPWHSGNLSRASLELPRRL